ncbi:hypothetical protein DYBT9275_05859 [Dyadobacter sp. CECT 9275]|uniref:Uncharacterized protein n=1 Tax=Dyadobacter helix TaxID=2822344 RepID=A0A916JJ26_9BACT|nr:hypothetical protein DYBT9275_05859 [Dyadobacter sp. CECT 9275]
MRTSQNNLLKVVAGFFVKAQQKPQTGVLGKSEDFDTFFTRIKANSQRIKSA